jgi:hypothetical protein
VTPGDAAVSPVEFTAPIRQNPEPSTPFRPAQFSGLAPDDSLAVLNVAGRDGNVIAVPATGATAEISGSFAGWLRTDWQTRRGGALP